jgi:hypothetical protein
MAPKVHGHHHGHRAHHGHRTHRQHAHHGQKAHNGGAKTTKTDKPTAPPQAAQGTPPKAPTAPAAPQQAIAPKDKFTPPTAAPVNLAPGATGERKAPPSVVAGAPMPATGAAAPVPKAGAPTPPAGTAAMPAPTPDIKPAISEANHLQWIGQMAPTGAATDYNGLMNCGPAAGAMIARDIGFEFEPKMTDAALVNRLAEIGQTSPTLGTTGNGMLAMYEEMGLETAATRGADMDWINSQLSAGRYVTALGDYYAVPERLDDSKTAGHYLALTGYHEATPNKDAWYAISDPAASSVDRMTAAQLQSFITSAPEGGFAISCWAAAAAATPVV